MTNYQHSMERVLYNLHYKLCSFALQNTTSRGRRWAERFLLFLFLSGCSVTLLVHVSFVHRDTTTIDGRPLHSIPLTCLRNVPGFSEQMDVTHISLLDTDSTRSSYAFESVAEDLNSTTTTTTATIDACSSQWTLPIHYSHSRIQGYLLLSKELCSRHDIRVQYVVISRKDEGCFGGPLLQQIISVITGTDTAIFNWLLGTFNSEGFIYNPRSKVVYDLSLYEQLKPTGRWYQQIYSKVGVVLKTCFLFFIVTTLVSFILRETQERMLEFTNQLQTRVRLGRPITYLVFTHLVENLVFVPVLVGMIFFLIEFYRGDKVASFMILSIVWVCEAFSIISLRSKEGLHFFPRMFFLEYSIVHFYMFMFPFGYSYIALASTAVCVIHSMLFFWHRYELPAVALGYVTLENPRMGAMVHSNGTSSLVTEPEAIWPPPPSNRPQQQNLRHPPRLPESLLSPRGQSSNSLERMSRQSSSIFNVAGDDDDSVSSYMYLLNGEVVVHRHRSATPTSALVEDNNSIATDDHERSIPTSISTVPSAQNTARTQSPSRCPTGSDMNTPASPVIESTNGQSNAATPRVNNRTPPDATMEGSPYGIVPEMPTPDDLH